jgi:hypothetical protein
MSARQNAGLAAKMQGHALEVKLVKRLGDDFKLVNDGNKTDLQSIDGKFRISLKNSSSPHTQVALISQATLINFLNLDSNGSAFVKLFFGFSDGTKLNQKKLNSFGINIEKLDVSSEVDRNRVLYNNIPIVYSKSFMSALNDDSKKDIFFSKLISGDSNILAWTLIKNNENSVRFAYMCNVLSLLKKGTWSVSSGNSTIELVFNGQRLLYVQMKGSSTRFGSGYHSCMFHLYRNIMNELSVHNELHTMVI